MFPDICNSFRDITGEMFFVSYSPVAHHPAMSWQMNFFGFLGFFDSEVFIIYRFS